MDSAEGGWSPLPVSGGVRRRGDDGHGGRKAIPSLTDAFAKALRTFLPRSTSSRGLSLL